MIQLYNLAEAGKWDACIKSFEEWDVYYLSGYVKAFHIHGDGEPYLLYYQDNGLRAIYVYMRRETALPGVYDSVTPYGYGGVLFDGNTSEEKLMAFWQAYVKKMQDEGIVDNFVRYHPVLKNAAPMKELSNVIDLGKTIVIDLTSPDVIWGNIISKNRNMIRKAEENGITIHHGKSLQLFKKFRRIYKATMDRDNADDYYYFDETFFESIHRDLKGNYEIFYAVLNDEIIAMSIILYGNRQMHYHLSGSMKEYSYLPPSNLLLYKAALWGYEQGFKTFHLGGGVGSHEDNLYKFKAAFNRNSDYQFSIGKEIFVQEKYDELVALRVKQEPDFQPDSNFFPLYRS
jgi:hypothetical protein